MLASLVHHPHTQASPVASIVVDLARDGARLSLQYRVTGGIADLLLPQRAEPARADELWHHSCLEAFIRPQSGDDYVEVNLSPSTLWAVYHFLGYRHGMSVPDVRAPAIRSEADAAHLILNTELDFAGLLPADEPWDLGLAAVIEERSGAKNYWALAHPPGPPDFHRQDCFVLQLPPATPE